ncbi:glycosyltransferase [Rhizobium tumorigenes]|uniref:glycosyltransferase n=1 Tax=Rhizobium tumorigenes TaxID=2041385 RepID=UPI00241F25E9|nr:glycosyltransferase [Rhizobium tumorigenes]WFS03672.1 glycosyltransferase [Rhizobium tumorigenes]
MHPLRVLYVQPGTQSFAGIERVVDDICTELSNKFGSAVDIDVLYTTIHNNRPTTSRAYNIIERVARSRLHLLQTFRSVIKGKHYDVVVVPQIEPTVMCMVACLGIKRNFAMHLHGNPHRERGHLKAKILFWMMKNIFMNRVAHVFGTSPRQLASFKAMFDSRVPQTWVPNPVRRFSVGKRDKSESTITFVNVGRISFQKGQDNLIDAFYELCNVRSNVRLKIIGYGAGKDALVDKIRRLKLDDSVTIEYYPDSPEAPLSSADVYISTSRWEGWSLAICEALRFGLPVISTDCEFGPSDILVDQRLGRLVPENDMSALVDSMIYYCDNLDEESKHAEFRRQYIDRFDVERVVDDHANALLSASKKQPSWSARG